MRQRLAARSQNQPLVAAAELLRRKPEIVPRRWGPSPWSSRKLSASPGSERAPRRRHHESAILFLRNQVGQRTARLLEAGEVPQVRKVPALLRLHWLHGAVLTVEEDAFAIRLVHQRQAAPVGAQPRELLDELVLAHAAKGGCPSASAMFLWVVYPEIVPAKAVRRGLRKPCANRAELRTDCPTEMLRPRVLGPKP